MRNLAAIRKKKGFTQIELANEAGIASNSLARYERGEMQPTIEVAKLLANSLGVTVDELLNGPKHNDWDLKLVIAREGEEIDMTTTEPDATLSIKDNTMTVSLTAGYDLWEDDAKFDGLIEMLRARRSAGLRLRKENW